MKILKQVCGIDISKDTFVFCLGTIDIEQNLEISKSEKYVNTKQGFIKLESWLKKKIVSQDIPLWFVMEATGVYYENLAYHLSSKGYNITVLLPNKAKHYARTLENKSKTDSIDSSILTRFGLERKLENWTPPKEIYKQLKALSRERSSIISMRTQIKNQLHAKSHSFKPGKSSLKRAKAILKHYKKLIADIEEEMKTLVKADAELNNKVEKIATIKGVGFLTIVTAIAETNGFALIRNKKQLASYAGYDVVLNESGQKKGATKISRKGNSHLRKALYMPALSAIKSNQELKNIFTRIFKKRKIKKVAIIAVARKLLLLIYALWKNDQKYIINYQHTLGCKNI